jgi:hypothetical protein
LPVNPMDPMQLRRVVPPPFQGRIIDAPPTCSPTPTRRERTWHCLVSDCSSSFFRLQDRKRHLLAHLPPWIHCAYPGCSWKGNRPSAFKNHWSANPSHPSSSQDLEKGQSIIYDPFPLVESIEEGTLSIHDARKRAMSTVRVKALELGMPGLCDDTRGRKRKRAQPSDTRMSSRSAEREKGNLDSHLEGRDDKEVEKAKVR